MNPQLNTIIEEATSRLEEYGDLHSDDCFCMDDDSPDSCNCDMMGMKEFLETEIRIAVEETIKEIRHEFIQIAIKSGKETEDEWKGAMLYMHTLNYFDTLKVK